MRPNIANYRSNISNRKPPGLDSRSSKFRRPKNHNAHKVSEGSFWREVVGSDSGRGATGHRRDRTLGEETTSGGRQAAAGGSADQPATTLSPLGRAGDHPNQETGVGRRQQRGWQGVESVRSPHRSHWQRESAEAQRVW